MKHTVAIVTHAHVLQNFYTTRVRGVACEKQRLGPKLEGAWLGEHPKIWDPLRISATVDASNFKFGTQLRFGTSLPKNDVLYQNWATVQWKNYEICWAFSSNTGTSRTDRQTDKRTDLLYQYRAVCWRAIKNTMVVNFCKSYTWNKQPEAYVVPQFLLWTISGIEDGYEHTEGN